MIEVRIVTGSYPRTTALIDGTVTSGTVLLEYEVARPANSAFRKLANDLAYDAGELAVITYLIAHERDRPLLLLPIVLMAQPELATLICRKDAALHTPADLAGARVAVRSYSQTTATWVRGIVDDLAGVGEEIRWATFEASHVDGYLDPAEVERLDHGSPIDALRAGEVDAALVGWEQRTAEGFRQVLDGADELEAAWRRAEGVVPANHFLAVRRELLERDPAIAGALIEMFAAARAAGEPRSGEVPEPVEREEIAASLDRAAAYAHRQGITARRWTPAEMLAG